MSSMENNRHLPNEEVDKYFDENYFTVKFAREGNNSKNSQVEFDLGSVNEFSSHNFTMDDTPVKKEVEITANNISNADEIMEDEKISQGLHNGMDNADEQNSRNLDFTDENFVDAMVRSSKSIDRLEKSIEHKNEMLLNSEKIIKMLFTETMKLQKQVLASHKYTCEYMTEDLRSVGSLLGRLDKPVEKTKIETEVILWEKENEKTKVLLNSLKEYFTKTVQEIFSKNYENLLNLPFFTMLLSDNTSILHSQFFDHYNELFIRGQVNTSFIQNLHDGFSRLKFNVHRKFTQLTERANNIFRSITQENHSIYEYNSGSEDEVEILNPDEENIDDNSNYENMPRYD